MINANANLVKEINLNMMRNVLKSGKIATKPKSAELTGLSVVTVNSLINILVTNGEVIEDVTLPSNGGRPAVAFRFNSEYSLVLIIYMHEQNKEDTAFVCISNLYGEVIEKNEKTMIQVENNSFNYLIEEMILKYPNIKVISFGMPGVEVDGRLLISDYKELRNQCFTSYIQEKFQLPVIFENGINAAVEGYCYSNGVPEEQCVIGIYFPRKYPLGAGIYINGNIYKGRSGLAGEIKYLPLEIDWENFDYNRGQMKEIIIKTVLSFNCMYNPDIIVLYGEEIGESIIGEIKRRCNSEIEKIMIPEIVISKKFNYDFEIGVKQIALKALQPTLRVKR